MKSKRQKVRMEENYTTSSPDDWLLPFLGSDLRLDYQKKKSLISSKKKKGMITANCKMREGKRICPSLSLYRVSKPLLLTTGTLRGSQRTMDQSTHRNLGKRRLYLSLHPDPYGRRLFNFFFLKKHQLFLGFSSLPLFHFRANTLYTSFNLSLFQLFLLNYFFSAHTNGGTSTYTSTAPFLIGTLVEALIIRSHPNQASRKSCA